MNQPDDGNVVYLPNASVETAGEVLEGELLSEEESAAVGARLANQRILAIREAAGAGAVALKYKIQKSAKPAKTFKGALRAGITVFQGVESWAVRAWDAGTMGAYRRQIKSAEAAGDVPRLADWLDRKEQAKERRHKRLMDMPRLAMGVAKAAGFCMAGLVLLVLLIGLFVQLSGAGEFTKVITGVVSGARWVFLAIAFAWTPFVMALPVFVLIAAWREGKRRKTPPGWLQRLDPTFTGGAGALVTCDGIVTALRHLGIPALNTAFKGGWVPRFELTPTREGTGAFKGYRTIFDTPQGVPASKVADQREVLAKNLHRNAVEVWPSDYGKEKGGKAGYVNLYVANSGVMDRPTPTYPLLHEGTADVFAGVPVGITQRGDTVLFPLVGSNFVFGGQPGQGKSNAGRVVMLGAALDPLAELRVHVFAKNGDFDAYAPRLARYHKGATLEHAELAMNHLEELKEEVERREERLAELGAKKLTRAIAEKYPDMRPIIVNFSECHELFGKKDFGELAADLAVDVVKRGRKTGVVTGFDTQSSRANAIPGELVENIGINGCFSVKTWRSNDGFLGDGSFAAGIRATDLRFNIDRGTMVATGVSEELFEIVRTFFVEVDDDAGFDAATEVIARAMGTVASGVAIDAAPSAPQIEAPRNLLEDLDEVLGNDLVPAADMPALLRDLAPRWAPYRTMTGKSLCAQLAKLSVKVPSTGNRWPVDPVAVRRALAEQSTADLDDEEDDWPS
jgi:DNA segregation ATPase FtsK/SpoIIIE, S-DNA-T family